MDIFEIIFCIVAFIAVLEIVLGIVIFINKIKKCEKREIVKILLKPGSLFIIQTFIWYIICLIYNPLFIKFDIIIMVMVGGALILISRYITISVLSWDLKRFSSVMAFLFGIATFAILFFIYYSLIYFIPISVIKGSHAGLVLWYKFITYGSITLIVSISLNMNEVSKKNFIKKRRKIK